MEAAKTVKIFKQNEDGDLYTVPLELRSFSDLAEDVKEAVYSSTSCVSYSFQQNGGKYMLMGEDVAYDITEEEVRTMKEKGLESCYEIYHGIRPTMQLLSPIKKTQSCYLRVQAGHPGLCVGDDVLISFKYLNKSYPCPYQVVEVDGDTLSLYSYNPTVEIVKDIPTGIRLFVGINYSKRLENASRGDQG